MGAEVDFDMENFDKLRLENERLRKKVRELESARPEAPQNADTARLDALEKDVNERGPLLLHNLRVTGNFRGLGLASTGRSLRKAIDDMAPHAVSVPSPLRQKP